MTFPLDTNAVRHLVVAERNADVMRWLATVDDGTLSMSTITVRELWYGIEKRSPDRGRSKDLLRGRVERMLEAFETRTLPVDSHAARVRAAMLARSNKHVDGTALAATAAVHGLAVVTRNVAHLRGRGVPLLSPFRPPAVPIGPAT